MTASGLQHSIFDHTPETLAQLLRERDQQPYRAQQVLRWVYGGAAGYAGMSDLPAALRADLAETLQLWTLQPVGMPVSSDGSTRKALFRLPDGALVETVYMRHPGAKGGWRGTVCVSSQAGCAYGCAFCATGQQGYGRNLSAGEIVQQAAWWHRRDAGGLGPEAGITNVVFMGMGEPFANYDAVLAAARAMNAPWGLRLGARHITISTVGLVPQIRRFMEEPLQLGLAISLHAPDDALRTSLMPVNRKYPLGELLPVCREYVARTRRRVTFEYVLLGGVNDGLHQARALARLLDGLLCHVNLIPVNPTQGAGFVRPSRAQIDAFVAALGRAGVPVTLRDTQGIDIQAGCGQLRVRSSSVSAS